MPSLVLPRLPTPHKELTRYIADHPETPIAEILQPYREYETTLRQLYAQDPGNQVLRIPDLIILPLFTIDSPGIHIRARDPAAESEQQTQQYIMAFPDAQRRPGGSPAVVESFEEFQNNFNVFSESSLTELDWTNVVAAGSSVVNCLLPVPERYNTSKRRLREFYHEEFCPASDVDLFLYGMTDEEAIVKIRQIETAVRDAILAETTTVRTKNAITICTYRPANILFLYETSDTRDLFLQAVNTRSGTFRLCSVSTKTSPRFSLGLTWTAQLLHMMASKFTAVQGL